jgi:hypothetical protein
MGLGFWIAGETESSSILCRVLFFAGMGGEGATDSSMVETWGESLAP